MLTVVPVAHAGTTVDSIRKAQQLICGIDQSEAEFSTTDDHGARVAFDQDLCKAAATAVLGPNAKVVIKGYPDDQTSLAALRSGEIDLIPSLSADLSHTTESGISLTRPVLYDGVALMVPITSGIEKATDLSGKKICVLAETEAEVTLRAWFESHHLTFIPFPFQEEGEMEAAYVTNNCTGLAADLTRLAETRESFGPLAKNYALLPDNISKDPLAVAYRTSDEQWGKILTWTINILIQAEESGITASTAQSPNTSRNPTTQRLLGKTRELGRPLGLDDDWAANVILAVGNYGEIFNRNLGTDSPLKLPRGLNALWNQGGLMYALPLK
nr:transporter substrate-binding domain-containing protein [Granulicella arctica]